ncbi:MAG: phosphatidate cytidylyltransferase [Thermoanaerobaculia bacterium]|nr:phosphatidate cytidylyltransferase [Thermoanaerobaculia bacterium]
MKRLVTAAVGIPLAMAAAFLLPPRWLFLLLVAVVEIQVVEFVRMTRSFAHSAPRWTLLLLVPAAAVLLSPAMLPPGDGEISWEYLLAASLALSVGVGALVVLGGTDAEEAPAALGVLGFGVVYFSLPVACLFYLRRIDPWLLVLACVIVWLGDAAAYYVGTRLGRHKLAERLSPKKTWEGAVGGLAAAVVGAALWSYWRLGEVRPALVLLAGATSVGAQLGDLLESMLKRGSGCKDSGALLPGHGGMMDRMDAMMFGAPVMAVGIWLVGIDLVAP